MDRREIQTFLLGNIRSFYAHAAVKSVGPRSAEDLLACNSLSGRHPSDISTISSQMPGH